MLALEIASPSTEDWAVPVTAMRVQEWRDREGQLCALGYADGRSGWLEWPGLATFAFTEGSSDVVAIPHSLAVPSTRLTIEDIFQRSASPIILQAIGWEALHASAVLIDQGVVGFCGVSESGKSTLAHALSRLGCPHLADDSLLLDFGGPTALSRPVVELVPFNARLRLPARAFFGLPDPAPVLLASMSTPPASISPSAPSSPSQLKLSALFVLDRNGAPAPRVTEMTPADAFTNALTHAYCFNPVDERSKRRIVANYLSIVSQVRVFRLEFSGELRHLERMATAIFETLSGARC
jgi:hypothetical protein